MISHNSQTFKTIFKFKTIASKIICCYNNYMKFNERWYEVLRDKLSDDFFCRAKKFVDKESEAHRIFPPREQVYNAYNLVDPDQVRVIILGQDPYHELGQAHGLSFSVLNNTPPPSLVNIYKEIKSDIGHLESSNGDLTNWANQGVFLLNAVLTVQESRANSHKGKIWEEITGATIKYLGQSDKPKVFMLWGRDARNMKQYINTSIHLVLESPHPSPLSAYNGFFGCKHFSKANQFLLKHGEKEIKW